MDDLQKLMSDFGLAKDAKRMQILQEVFNTKIPERLTVIPTKKHVIHLNYMKRLGEVIGGEVGTFLDALWKGEVNHLYSLKGVSLEKFATILEQQNAGDITVRNETIPQQVTEKQGILARLRGKPSE